MRTDKLFTGQRAVAGLGIYHYGARFYSPKLGRFLSADSIVPGFANPQNLNRFSYVRNNPLRYTDSTGHWIDQGCGCTGNTRIAAPKPIVKGGPLVGNSDLPFKPAPKPSTPVIVTSGGGGAGGSNGGRRPGGRGGGSGSTTQSNTAIQGDHQPNIDMSGFVNALLGESTPVSGNGPLAGFTPVTINDLGFEILDPAPEFDNILFSNSPYAVSPRSAQRTRRKPFKNRCGLRVLGGEGTLPA